MKLLIVDDEQEILNMLERNFSLEGFDVTTTTDPTEAVGIMEVELFNLVMLDIKMPGKSGIELLREFKKINPLVNIIMMTGYSSMTYVVECLENGAVDYFVKPFSDLEIIIESLNQAAARLSRWQLAMDLKKPTEPDNE